MAQDPIWLVGKDRNNNVDFGSPFVDEAYQCVLSAGTTTTLNVPTGFKKVLITVQPGAVVYVKKNDTPVASTGSFVKTGAHMNPALKYNIDDGDSLGFRAVDDAEIGVIFFKV